MTVTVIAEVGSTWYRPDPAAAKQAVLDSIRAASKAGAGAVKFQIFTADTLYSRDRAPEQWERVRKYELPLDWLPEMEDTAERCNVELWASIFDPNLVRMAYIYLDGLKLASGDITNLPLLRQMAAEAKAFRIPLGISTGAATTEEIRQALEAVPEGVKVILFNCVSMYPTPPWNYDIEWLPYRDTVWAYGVSDHTRGMGLIEPAVRFGYRFFEVHFGLFDTPRDCPDLPVSMLPGGLETYVDLCRTTFYLSYRSERRVVPGEQGERVWARRGADGLRPAGEVK